MGMVQKIVSAIGFLFLSLIAYAQPPAPVVIFSPAQGATAVSVTTMVTWGASAGATNYDVYFGTTPSPPFVMNTTGLSYSPGLLSPNTLYYWSVTAKNSSGATPSVLWFFTTGQSTGTSGLQFVPVTPCRVMDTRGATGVLGGPAIAGGTMRAVPVPQSPCNIPPAAQASSLNVTVVPLGPLGFLSIW